MGKLHDRIGKHLTIYVRQLGWLNAVPKPPEGSRRASASEPRTQSRLDAMRADGIEPQMPPNPAPHIVTRLLEIGLTEAAGMGSGPVTWQSINAWESSRRMRLDRWEARLIRRLSIEYLAESRRAESENCPAPWRGEITAREREVEMDRLRSVLG